MYLGQRQVDVFEQGLQGSLELIVEQRTGVLWHVLQSLPLSLGPFLLSLRPLPLALLRDTQALEPVPFLSEKGQDRGRREQNKR